MSAVCSSCLRSAVVMLTHTVVYRGKSIEWRECVSCNREAEQRALESIRQAERAGA